MHPGSPQGRPCHWKEGKASPVRAGVLGRLTPELPPVCLVCHTHTLDQEPRRGLHGPWQPKGPGSMSSPCCYMALSRYLTLRMPRPSLQVQDIIHAKLSLSSHETALAASTAPRLDWPGQGSPLPNGEGLSPWRGHPHLAPASTGKIRSAAGPGGTCLLSYSVDTARVSPEHEGLTEGRAPCPTAASAGTAAPLCWNYLSPSFCTPGCLRTLGNQPTPRV